jgi:hypothetical protein
MHPQRMVLLFNMTGGYAAHIRHTRYDRAFGFNNFGRAIPTGCVFVEVRDCVGFYQLGVLCLPAQAEPPNAVLGLLINNDSLVDADDVVVRVGFSKNLFCSPDAGWITTESKSLYGFNNQSGEKMTRKPQEWAFDGSGNGFGLLSGNGLWLPNIHIKQESSNEGWGSFEIMVRAKGCPAELLVMNLIFAQNSTNLPPLHRPFVILAWTNSDGREIFKITPKQLIEMQK